MSPEETFRRVLAARLPAGPGWTAWIDSTVSELAASVPEDHRFAQIRALCDERSHDPIEADPIWPDELRDILQGAA